MRSIAATSFIIDHLGSAHTDAEVADLMLAALDLATSLDVRERSAGLQVLADRLERFA